MENIYCDYSSVSNKIPAVRESVRGGGLGAELPQAGAGRACLQKCEPELHPAPAQGGGEALDRHNMHSVHHNRPTWLPAGSSLLHGGGN